MWSLILLLGLELNFSPRCFIRGRRLNDLKVLNHIRDKMNYDNIKIYKIRNSALFFY